MSTERIRGLTEAYNKIIGESLKENLNEEGGQQSTVKPPVNTQANPQFGRKFLNRPPSQYLDAVKTLKGTKTLAAPAPQAPQAPQTTQAAPVQTAPQTTDPKSEIDGLKNQIQILKLKQQVDALKKPVGTKPVKEDAEKGTKTLDAPAQQAPVKPISYGEPWKRSRADLMKSLQNPNKDHTGYPNQTTQKEDVFDIAKNQLIEEGHSEEEALSLMSSWTPEQINELRELIENMSDDDFVKSVRKVSSSGSTTTSQEKSDHVKEFNRRSRNPDGSKVPTKDFIDQVKRGIFSNGSPNDASSSESNAIVPKKPGLHRGTPPNRPNPPQRPQRPERRPLPRR